MILTPEESSWLLVILNEARQSASGQPGDKGRDYATSIIAKIIGDELSESITVDGGTF